MRWSLSRIDGEVVPVQLNPAAPKGVPPSNLWYPIPTIYCDAQGSPTTAGKCDSLVKVRSDSSTRLIARWRRVRGLITERRCSI